MYESYWKLERSAFQGGADAGAFFPSRTHHTALLKLKYLVENRQGAGVLSGAHGLGKTYLTHVLEAELEGSLGPVARMVFPQMSPGEMLSYLAAKLGAESPSQEALRTDVVLRHFESRLRELAKSGRHPILIVDEAHLLEPEHFQTLHLLTNLPQEAGTTFTLLLVGEPELLPKVQRVGALDDRITVRTSLRALTEEETRDYVLKRLELAGAPAGIFSREALRSLWETSRGVPRRINQLCDLSLLVGFADCLESVSHVEVEAAAEELAAVAVE
ncbi:MAG TPA: AAA family ATPase [Caulifigura sp.]|jgi:general secretion pathway protein A|nr:AAA family ATPase [Caulifigura sp.]